MCKITLNLFESTWTLYSGRQPQTMCEGICCEEIDFMVVWLFDRIYIISFVYPLLRHSSMHGFMAKASAWKIVTFFAIFFGAIVSIPVPLMIFDPSVCTIKEIRKSNFVRRNASHHKATLFKVYSCKSFAF